MSMLIGLQFIPVSASPLAKMYVDPPSQTVSASFSIDINVTDVADLYGWEFRLNYSKSILTPTGVTEGPFLANGSERILWVGDDDTNVYKTFLFDPSTSVSSWSTGTSKGPFGVEFVDGYIYFVDYGPDKLYKRTQAGGAVADWDISGYSGNAYGLGWDGTYFWIADRSNDAIYKVDPADPTTYVSAITYSAIGYCEGVTYDGTHLWVSDTGTDRIYKLTTTGGTVDYFPKVGKLAFDPNGITWDGTYLWICGDDDYIYKYSTAGTQLASYTAPGPSSEGLAFSEAAPSPPRSTYFHVEETDDTKGRVWATCTLQGDVAGLTGDGVLATINFDIDASGTSPLDLHQTKLEGYNFTGDKKTFRITHARYDGSVTVVGVPEFPLGAAAEIAIAATVIYIWWRKRKTKIHKYPPHSSAP